MSEMSYASVQIPYIQTRDIAIEAVMDESGVDLLYNKITIGVQFLLNAANSGGLAPADWIRINRAALETPRQSLNFAVNGKQVVNSDNTIDVKNGPIPNRLNIVTISGDQCMVCHYSVTTYLHECLAGKVGANGILSYRRSETVSRDETFFATLTRRVKVVFRGGMAPDTHRDLVYPPLLIGFRRIQNDWTVESDGCAYGGTVVDRECFLPPPAGIAAKASGEYTESTANIAQRFGEVRIRLDGAKEHSKPAMIQAAIQIALTKLRGSGRRVILSQGAVREGIWENWVEVSLRGRWATANPDAARGVTIKNSGLGIPPIQSDASSKNYTSIYGTSFVAATAAAIADWCNQDKP